MNFMMVVKGEEGREFHPSPLYPFHDCVGCPRCVVRHPRRHTNLSTSYRYHVELGEGGRRSCSSHAQRDGGVRRPELPEIPRNEAVFGPLTSPTRTLSMLLLQRMTVTRRSGAIGSRPSPLYGWMTPRSIRSQPNQLVRSRT